MPGKLEVKSLKQP